MELAKSSAEDEHLELADLRELLFRAYHGEQDEILVNENMFPYDVSQNTIIFGRHDAFLKSIRKLLCGNIRYVDKGQNFDTSIIRYADVLWIQTNALAHSQFYKIVDTAKRYNKQIRYFQYSSAAKCAEQVAENDV